MECSIPCWQHEIQRRRWCRDRLLGRGRRRCFRGFGGGIGFLDYGDGGDLRTRGEGADCARRY